MHSLFAMIRLLRRLGQSINAQRSKRSHEDQEALNQEQSVAIIKKRSTAEQNVTSATSPLIDHASMNSHHPVSGIKAAIKPIFISDEALSLYEYLVDQIEMSYPHLSIHSGVAVSACIELSIQAQQAIGSDYMSCPIDFVFVDETGLPLVALISDAETQGDKVDVQTLHMLLLNAQLPVVTFNQKSGSDDVWQNVQKHILYEMAA